jgi:small multidrug resistance family-3 protein
LSEVLIGEVGLANIAILAALLLAALLEVGGDALVRAGLHSAAMPARLGLLAVGGVVLLAYGVTVNLPPWDFGRLLGVYVALFFVLAQVVAWLAFGTRPTVPILVGGALILAGGLTITFWRG